jgi:hypothetical protein
VVGCEALLAQFPSDVGVSCRILLFSLRARFCDSTARVLFLRSRANLLRVLLDELRSSSPAPGIGLLRHHLDDTGPRRNLVRRCWRILGPGLLAGGFRMTANKQWQRTVTRHRGRVAAALFHCARLARRWPQRAAAELRG